MFFNRSSSWTAPKAFLVQNAEVVTCNFTVVVTILFELIGHRPQYLERTSQISCTLDHGWNEIEILSDMYLWSYGLELTFFLLWIVSIQSTIACVLPITKAYIQWSAPWSNFVFFISASSINITTRATNLFANATDAIVANWWIFILARWSKCRIGQTH